ncbi:hypothetical protein VP01_377g4 [Puccinia sorghi]|uniref:Uncharacterized protein n=1 Tax=Puccinia sorghi TaxID=27349 RepID=A0A0L6UTK9_9BASI|nr:hypothetical protein VP01_377g4 [Puccinia sorghi]
MHPKHPDSSADWEESEYVLVNLDVTPLTEPPADFVIITSADIQPGPGHQLDQVQPAALEHQQDVREIDTKADVIFTEVELEEVMGNLMTTGIFKGSEDSLPSLTPIKLQQIVHKLKAMGFSHPFRIDSLESGDWIVCVITEKWTSGTSRHACLDDYFPQFVAFKSIGFDIENGEGP